MKPRLLIRWNAQQASVLAERYLDVMLGDWGATALTIAQAPLIGALVAGVWANANTDTLTLYFVLCLSAFFLGAVNSAREIVKERALFLRERLLGISISSYLVSKYRVLTLLALLQCVVLVVIVRSQVPMRVNVFVVAVVLLATALVGTAVGLAISAFVRTPDKAVAAVPIAVIPQILFSDFVIGRGKLSNWAGHVEKVMPVRWSYDILRELHGPKWDLIDVLIPASVVVGMLIVLFFFALAMLVRSEE